MEPLHCTIHLSDLWIYTSRFLSPCPKQRQRQHQQQQVFVRKRALSFVVSFHAEPKRSVFMADRDSGSSARRSRERHLAAGDACRVEPIVAWAEAIWDEQLDDVDLHRAWRRWQRLVDLKPPRSKVSGPTGAIIMWQLGWSWPHHAVFITANGHELDLRQICPRDVKSQAMVDSELALWKDWAGDSDERKELLPCPLLEPAIRARGASDQGSLGDDTIRLVDAGSCAQGRND